MCPGGTATVRPWGQCAGLCRRSGGRTWGAPGETRPLRGPRPTRDLNFLGHEHALPPPTDGERDARGRHPLFGDPRLVSRGPAHQRATAEARAVGK